MAEDSPLELLARPLRFASRNGFQNLAVLRDLEGWLQRGVDRARKDVKKGSSTALALDQIEKLAPGIDRAPAKDRAERVQRILDALEAALSGAAPPELPKSNRLE